MFLQALGHCFRENTSKVDWHLSFELYFATAASLSNIYAIIGVVTDINVTYRPRTFQHARSEHLVKDNIFQRALVLALHLERVCHVFVQSQKSAFNYSQSQSRHSLFMVFHTLS